MRRGVKQDRQVGESSEADDTLNDATPGTDEARTDLAVDEVDRVGVQDSVGRDLVAREILGVECEGWELPVATDVRCGRGWIRVGGGDWVVVGS